MKRLSSDNLQRKTKWFWLTLGSLLVVLSVVGTLAAIGYLKYRQIQASMAVPPPPEMPVAVTLAISRPITFRQSSVVVGSVLASQSIRLRTELTGVVTEVAMAPGQSVRKGELLIKMDTRTEQAELKSATAKKKLASADFQRAQRLSSANASTAQELDVAAAALTQSEAEIERLQILIDKKTLVAPFDARVGLFDLHVGQYLETGTEITTLEGIAEYLNIDFAMPSHVADSIKVGQTVRVKTSVQSTELTASIIAIDSQADPISRSVTARARLDHPPADLLPNDPIRVIVEYGDPISAQAIPATAVRRGPTGTLVFVAVPVEGQLRAQARSVLLAGAGDGFLAWIGQGLQTGEQIVADGSFKVSDGAMLVEVAKTPAGLNSTRAVDQESSLSPAVEPAQTMVLSPQEPVQ